MKKSGKYLFLYYCLFAFSRAAPVAYGDSQAKGLIGAVATGLSQSHSNEGSKPRLQPTYTTAHSNAESLTQWARPGIEPATSWFLVGFVNHCATTGTPFFKFKKKIFFWVVSIFRFHFWSSGRCFTSLSWVLSTTIKIDYIDPISLLRSWILSRMSEC